MAADRLTDTLYLPETRERLYELLRSARDLALKYFQRKLGSKSKADGSPVSEADEAVHRHLADRLPRILDLPVVSEEGGATVDAGPVYWLIDPLDGTKEFLAGIPEFTINVAVVSGTAPLLGAMDAPGRNTSYFGLQGEGAWIGEGRSALTPLKTGRGSMFPRIAVSRYHVDDATRSFLSMVNESEYLEVGSALKFCALALGEAEIYPRFVGTREWDTAAGQCILEACGGAVVSLVTGETLTYGKKDRLNGPFVAFGPGFRSRDEMVAIARALSA